MDEMIRGILEAAIQAPSGENAQPWRFRVKENTILQFHDVGSDESLYNYNGYGTLVAHGAALENMALAATAKGYKANIELFPDSSNKNLIAEIKIVSSAREASAASLSDSISSRVTNRKPYETKPLSAEAGSALERVAALFASQGITYTRITDRKKMAALAEVASTNERIMLGNKELHHFFFSHLTWTPEEDARVKRGFYIKTLELPPPIQVLFKLFKHWPVMNVLKKIGFPVLVGKGNAKTYATSAEIGVIRVPVVSRETCLLAGRLFERLWLTAASLGLQFQPLTGTIFMQIFADHVPQGHFSITERTLLKEMTNQLNGTVGKGAPVLLMFRVGYGDAPSAKAQRFSLSDLLHTETVTKSEKLPMNRMQKINEIQNQLNIFKADPRFSSQAYAIEENRRFLTAIRSPLSYLRWYFGRGCRLDSARILELTDFPFDPWDEEMHRELMALEQRPQPGLVRPLVEEIAQAVMSLDHDAAVISLGSGGMEVDRQVIERLKILGYKKTLTIVGVDIFESTHEIAAKNLIGTTGVLVERFSSLDAATVDAARTKPGSQFRVLLCPNDIFLLPQKFSQQYFDIAYHSLFKHHLTLKDQERLDHVIRTIASRGIEFDGFRNWPIGLIQSVFAWHSPVFLNGTIFSMARYQKKADLKKIYPGAVFFPKTAHYLRKI